MKTVIKIILRMIRKIVFRFAEKTPPKVKFSQRNYNVAQIGLIIDNLLKNI